MLSLAGVSGTLLLSSVKEEGRYPDAFHQKVGARRKALPLVLAPRWACHHHPELSSVLTASLEIGDVATSQVRSRWPEISRGRGGGRYVVLRFEHHNNNPLSLQVGRLSPERERGLSRDILFLRT